MSDKADDLRFYEAVRARLEHEDNLIVQRLSWLMGAQAFLFTAYAISTNAPPTAAKLARLLPLVGIVSAALTYLGLFGALGAMKWLHSSFRERGVTEQSLGLPPLLTPLPLRRCGLAGPLILPGLFLAAWIYLLGNMPA